MTWAIDTETLEQAIVRHCSPTLAALKPASLFTFPGNFAGKDACENRAALQRTIDGCNEQLDASQVCIRVLAWRERGALIYVFRPAALAASLQEPQAAGILERMGYESRDPAHCLRRLQHRLAAPQHTGTFPHEIGLFLGYPPADVAAFIRNGGKNYAALGLWKAYTNVDAARVTWVRYRRCTRALARTYHIRGSLAAVAVRTPGQVQTTQPARAA